MLDHQILPYLIIVLYTVKLCVSLNRALREGQLHTENCARWIVVSIQDIMNSTLLTLLTVTLAHCGHYLTSMLQLSHVL